MMGMNTSSERQPPEVKSLCHYHEQGKDKLSVDACKQMLTMRKRISNVQQEYLEVVVRSKIKTRKGTSGEHHDG